MNDTDNHRHTADKRGTYEVWYMTWNHPGTDQGFWLRYITEQPLSGPARGELWFARFDPKDPARTFGFHKQLAIEQVSASTSPFSLSLGASRLGHDHAVGQADGDGHSISWDLRWMPAASTVRLLPDLAYSLKIGETVALWPNQRVPMTGSLVVDGERLSFDHVPLGQCHLWGTKHAYNWTWAHCVDFAGAPDAGIELLAVKLHKRGRTIGPLVMLHLDLDGERHDLHQFRHVARNRAQWGGTRVTFTAQSLRLKVEGELTCEPRDMILAPYEDPDGTHVYCSNTEIGDAHLTVYKRSGMGWREHRTLVAKRRAHFELGGRERDPAVAREHIVVP
ncbi:MAG TPA: tocopherol cyclase family protein [Kofleriaceae bacterium]|nr:tocopherol cyclase family protein [Kofleriaceae bacterium]